MEQGGHMKIFVIGASGGVGTEVVQQALQAGHEVTAFVRNAARMSIEHPRLTVVQGDGHDEAAVASAIQGHHSVVCCVGGKGLGAMTLQAAITRNLVSGMQKHNVNRIAYVASAGIHRELKGISGVIVTFVLRKVLADHRSAYEVLRDSGLRWTIARPMQLTKGPLTSSYRETFSGIASGGQKISRADVAHFLLKSLADDQYVNQSVGLVY